uniref:Uncharacterized protein n=1 Tax=Arundo donax TaxID=35708 RepID=A0A0A9B3I0_ARUDO
MSPSSNVSSSPLSHFPSRMCCPCCCCCCCRVIRLDDLWASP